VVFTATKRSAEELTERMVGWGVRAAALHGDMTQRARTRTLDRLRRGEVQVLVATDVAARGIDVAGISHVINFDPPRQAEDYVHRIGRTGRAGRSGVAITLTHPNEMRTIGAIERFTGRRLVEHVIEGLEPRAPRRPAGGGRGGFEGSRGGKPSGPRTPAPRRSEDSPRRWGDSPRSHEGRQERAAAPRAYGETAPRSEFERRVRGDDGDRRTLGVSGERKPRSSWGNKDQHPQRDGEGWGRRRRDR
jgi:superfamily II DNA/RNA helicase